jgi:hypothetical protein
MEGLLPALSLFNVEGQKKPRLFIGTRLVEDHVVMVVCPSTTKPRSDRSLLNRWSVRQIFPDNNLTREMKRLYKVDSMLEAYGYTSRRSVSSSAAYGQIRRVGPGGSSHADDFSFEAWLNQPKRAQIPEDERHDPIHG